MLHCDAVGRADLGAKTATDAQVLVHNHGGPALPTFRLGQPRFLRVAIDTFDQSKIGHVQYVGRTDLDTSVTKYAIVSIQEDVQLALQAAAGLLKCLVVRQPKLYLCGQVESLVKRL